MIKVGIIGATGYTGKELLRILLGHPEVEVEILLAKMEKEKIPISRIFKEFSKETELLCQDFDSASIAHSVDLIFTCLPHRISMEIIPEFFARGKRIIDLSADFRLKDTSIYKQWYGAEHKCPDLVSEAVYGLPELNRDKIREAQLVANPGCYPTAVILALAPLVKEKGLIDLESIIIDAKTGISGAGRNPTLINYFPERTENLTPYKITSHQHIPEIEQELRELAGQHLRVTFTPHLVPINRGILASIYLSLKREVAARDLYLGFYKDEPFVRILDDGQVPEIKDVCRSNYCDLAIFTDGRIPHRLILFSSIDNLVKGAAGQAVQNMNIMYGFNETTGLRLSSGARDA